MKSGNASRKQALGNWLRAFRAWPLSAFEPLSPLYYLPDALVSTEDLFSADPLSPQVEAAH